MSKGFFSLLEERARQIDSLLCVGLDPHPAELPEPTAQAARDLCLRLIEMTSDVALAYKPNAAFFEAFGAEGWAALKAVIAAVPEGIPVILDAKRGDISSTAEAYARSTFKELGADALTINPYLGYDSIKPFINDPSRGVFLLCKTSNPGSVDFQDLPLGGANIPLTLHEKVALAASEWNTQDNIGLVVGATQPASLQRLRELVPDLWFLAPGIGAQGGDLTQALQAGLRADGLGLLIPVSRGIMRAANPRQAALDLVAAIRTETHARQKPGAGWQPAPAAFPAHLADSLLAAGCVRFGQFTLKSGLISPIYIDLRQLISHPHLLAEVSAAYIPLLSQLEFDTIAALPYAALPIVTTISLQAGWPFIFPRKESKGYGTRADIEGRFNPGDRVVVVDDLATTGGTKFEGIEKLTSAGLVVKDVVVLIDRQSGAAEALAEAGLTLRAVFTLTELLDHWERTGKVPDEQIQAVREFLASTK